MPGPWERYQTTTPAAEGPWTKYQGATGALKAEKEAPEAPIAPPEAENTDRKIGLGEKAAGVLAAPGFYMSESLVHPIDTLKTVGKGIIDTPEDAGKKAADDIKAAGGRFKRVVSPDPSQDSGSTLNRVKNAGVGALNVVQAPFELPLTALENTYGRVASEGSKMASPDGKPIVTPSEASILPSFAIGGNKSPKKLDDFGQAATRFGMNFKGAKGAEDIASEITRATGSYFDKLSNMIWDRSPAKTPTGQPGEIAANAAKNFGERKNQEKQLWQSSETMGNNIPVKVDDQVSRLQALRKQVADRIKSGEDTPDVKKAQALIDRTLGELGHPVSPEQSVVEKTIERGGVTKRTEGLPEYAPDATRTETTTKDVDPTLTRGPRMVSAKTQEPVNSKMVREGTARTTTTDPYKTTVRTIKGDAPIPPRAANAGDLVRARRAANDTLYSTADGKVASEVKDILNGGLSDAAKSDKNFGRAHSQALKKTQSNADLYRDDAKAAKFGFDEDTLNELRNKTKAGRQLSTETLEKINSGVDKIKTPEDLLFLQRHLDKPTFSMAMRAKAAAILADTGTDMDKVIKQRPMLEEIFKFSGIPANKSKQALDDLESVAKEMKRYNIPSKPEVNPDLTKAQARMRSIVKAITFGLAYSNPKQALYHGVQAIAPSANAEASSLNSFAKRVTPKKQSSVTGAGVGAYLSGKDQDQ